MKITYKAGSDELTEKKSRFIADVFPLHSEEEAPAILESVKKKYWDARHHAYAYICGENQKIARFSDDGEPQGTGGRPVLELLKNEEMTNTLIIVTRYFGGTLLGTGGLTRAYGGAAALGLKASGTAKVRTGVRVELGMDYAQAGKAEHLIRTMDMVVLGNEYGAGVTMKILSSVEVFSAFREKLNEITGASHTEIVSDPLKYYVSDDGAVHFIT
jgi:uncharacterized YigZ family protein